LLDHEEPDPVTITITDDLIRIVEPQGHRLLHDEGLSKNRQPRNERGMSSRRSENRDESNGGISGEIFDRLIDAAAVGGHERFRRLTARVINACEGKTRQKLAGKQRRMTPGDGTGTH
jgi:hypothetical protein